MALFRGQHVFAVENIEQFLIDHVLNFGNNQFVVWL